MISFIFSRIKTVWAYMFFVASMTLVCRQFSDFFDSIGFPAILVCMNTGVPSNWIQILPYSRKKIMAWYAVENLLIAISAALVILILGIASENIVLIGSWSEISGKISFWGFVILIVALIRFCIPYKNEAVRQYSNIGRKRFLKISGLFFVVLLLIRYLGSQPLVWIVLAAGLLTFVPLISYAGVNAPRDSLRSMRIVCTTIFLGVVVVLSMAGLGTLYYRDIDRHTNFVMTLLGDLKIKMTKERSLELLKSRNIGLNKYSEYLNAQYGTDLSFDEIAAKAEKCNSEGCFSFVTVNSRRFSADQRIELFSKMLIRCELTTANRTYVYCKREIAFSDLNELFKLFSETLQVYSWLRSGEVQKRFVAIRILSVSSVSEKMSKEVSRVMKNFDDISSFEAKRFFRIRHEQELKKRAECSPPRESEKVDFEGYPRLWIGTEKQSSSFDH